jgi:bifunctional enzyme CysN/CysC
MHDPRERLLDEPRTIDLLRVVACGSEDAGKSTLITRLLHNSKLIFEKQLSELVEDRKRGTTGDGIDFPPLVVGLQSEREPGTSVGVTYRLFTRPRRSFIVADTRGHEQFTRSMVIAASNADLAVVLIDAHKGVLAQTRRHSFICSLLGIRHIVVVVNKIDLIDFHKETFDRIVGDYTTFATQLGFNSIVSIPASARFGDNIVERSGRTPWYPGPSLIEHLELIDVHRKLEAQPFRFPVQSINSPNADFRGYVGTVISGTVRVGDPIIVADSDQCACVREILTGDGPQTSARAGDAVTIMLAHKADIACGDLLVNPTARPELSDQFAAHLIWMSGEPLIPGRTYLARIGTKLTPISVTSIKHKVDVTTREHLAAHTLNLNDIAFCNLATAAPVAFDPYEQNRQTGSFIVINRSNNHTVGAGMIAFGLRRGTNIHWQPLLIGKAERAALKRQQPVIVWFTGLSGAGKSTIANIVEQRLHATGQHTMMLDGDNLRHGLSRDLGFTEADRVENIRRVGEAAKLILEGGLIVLCSFISPYCAERDMVRRLVGAGEFLEVFVDTPIDECIRRDPKGLYAKAKAGQIKNFTGFDAPYEPPQSPEIHLHTMGQEPGRLAERVIQEMQKRGILGPDL